MRRGRRYPIITVAVLLILGAIAVVGYRVFAPAETFMQARTPYPSARAARPGISGELPRAPLIVDGRLRVYAANRQVWADTPVGARTEATPFWSLRRWPYELVGVVVAPGPLVISKWSDGTLLATDARRGTTAWRTRSVVGEESYTGGQTGADTIYAPPDLYTGRAEDGRTVVVSAGAGRLAAFDATNGNPLWTAEAAPPCSLSTPDGTPGAHASSTGGPFTGPGFLALMDSCGASLRRYDLVTGRQLPDWAPPGARTGWELQPLGCVTGRSECTALRTRGGTGGQQGWLLAADLPEAEDLAASGTWLAGDLVVGGPDPSATSTREVVARSLETGRTQWTWRIPDTSSDRSPARIVAAEPKAIYMITEGRTLVVLDPENGRELTRSPLLQSGQPVEPWLAGQVYVSNRYVVVVRMRTLPGPGTEAQYMGLRPVLMAGS